MLAFFRICRYNLYCALRRRIEVVITGLTRNQVASRGLEGSNPSVSASATGNAFKRCLFSFHCAGGDGEPEPLRGLKLHAIGQPRCYILIRFACQQSLKGESLRPYRVNCQVKCNTFCNSCSNKSAGVWKFSTFFGLLFIFATFCASVFAESGQRCT